MTPQPRLSILICTRNRASSLAVTLEALLARAVPSDGRYEVVVVDNDSTDSTPAVVAAAAAAHPGVRHVRESRRGLSAARNRALREARGEALLFTDDDVIPSDDWAARLAAPLVAGSARAVAGGVLLAPHLRRPWLGPRHLGYLASSEGMTDPSHCEEMIGANMGFSRAVLEQVPAFDEELGAGALGFGDEALFSRQLAAAGIGILPRLDVTVEHHLEPERLERPSWLDAAWRRGRSHVYTLHHWRHEAIANPRLKFLLAAFKYRLHRIGLLPPRPPQGVADWELSLTFEMSVMWHYPRERRRPRNYERHGLVKLAARG